MLGEKDMLKCNLKTILDERGIKQNFIAKRVGASKQSLYAWTRNKSAPNLETAFKLAKELNCDITDIWEYEEDEED